MTYDQLIEHFGTAADAARALGYEHRQRVQKWKLTGIPREEQALVELVTAGKLTADIAPAARGDGQEPSEAPPSKIPGPVVGGDRPGPDASDGSSPGSPAGVEVERAA